MLLLNLRGSSLPNCTTILLFVVILMLILHERSITVVCDVLLCSLWNFLVRADISSDIKFTYRRDDLTAFSWPDHILSLSRHVYLVKHVSCEDSENNFSDHLPLSFSVAFTYPACLPSHSVPPHSNTSSTSNSAASRSSIMVDWSRVSPDNISTYCDHIQDNIPHISYDLLSGCDLNCKIHFVW